MKYKICIILAVCISVSVLITGCVPHSTGETEVGVRTRKLSLSGKEGVEDRIYEPGSTYFFLPFINDWTTFDTKLQNMEMTYFSHRGDRKNRDDLLFKTIDGNDISLDVIIAFRINPEKAPMILQYVAPTDEALREKIMRTIARSRTRDIFGELKTEEFYVADKRQKQSQKAKKALQDILEPMGVIVEKVMTKNYRFNPEYQKAIEAKKVADQKVEKYKATQRATVEEYKQKLEEARGEVFKMKAKIDGSFEKEKIRADAYYEQQKMIAKAIRTEGKNEAEGIRKMNNALSGDGGEAMVKLRVAEALNGKQIFLLPISQGGMNLKTTDMNRILETMGIQKMVTATPSAGK